MKPKAAYLKWKSTQFGKSLVRLTKQKWNTQITRIINERRDITNDPKLITVVKEYLEQLYSQIV